MITEHDKVLINHILDAVEACESFIRDTNIVDFVENDLISSAVQKKFEIIGEASNKLSKQTRDQFSAIAWKKIIGMRNILIHDYIGVDLEAVWNTIESDLPLLKRTLTECKFSDPDK